MTSDATQVQNEVVDVSRIIDERPWSRFQISALLLTALAVIMDGLDNRLLPLIIPPLIDAWGVSREAFAVVTSVGLIGMALGTMGGGMIGDRFGRRSAIIGSVLAFGLVTFANAFVTDMTSMIVMRFLAGLGLGALMPSAASMFAEYAPARRRALAVTLGMVCVPLGGTLSGLLGAAVLPVFGWRALFMIGGALAVAVAIVQLLFLSESPAYLARSSKHRGRLAFALGRMGYALDDNQTVIAESGSPSSRASVSQLFHKDHLLDTIGLWCAFLAILLCLYMESQWMPTILTGAGYSLEIASIASSSLAFGGMFACIFGVAAVSRFGSRRALMGMALAGVILTIGLTQYPLDPERSAVPLLALLALAGFLIGGLQIMIYSVATHAYPTALRATGIGWSVGIGRFGSVISPFVATAALAFGGWSSFFLTLAAGLAVTFVSLGLIRRHVPRAGK